MRCWRDDAELSYQLHSLGGDGDISSTRVTSSYKHSSWISTDYVFSSPGIRAVCWH